MHAHRSWAVGIFGNFSWPGLATFLRILRCVSILFASFKFVYGAMQGSGKADSERAAHAMADPEIQMILTDPVVRQVLNDFKENPQEAQKVLDYNTLLLTDSKLHNWASGGPNSSRFNNFVLTHHSMVSISVVFLTKSHTSRT